MQTPTSLSHFTPLVLIKTYGCYQLSCYPLFQMSHKNEPCCECCMQMQMVIVGASRHRRYEQVKGAQTGMSRWKWAQMASSGGSKGGTRDADPPGAQILSISCSFWENMAKSYVCTSPRGVGAPPRGNPRSASGKSWHKQA